MTRKLHQKSVVTLIVVLSSIFKTIIQWEKKLVLKQEFLYFFIKKQTLFGTLFLADVPEGHLGKSEEPQVADP